MWRFSIARDGWSAGPMIERHSVLILGGTAEAAALAAALAGDDRFAVTTSLAGRTRRPAAVAGAVRTGGFGGVDGLAAFLRAEGIAAVVDATHPFAETISRNAALACAEAGVARLRLSRPPWSPVAGDRWTSVDSLAEAAGLLPEHGRRAFLALGARRLAPFEGRRGVWYLIRTVEPPETPPIRAAHAVTVGRGPFSESAEIALLQRHRIDVLVARNSGGEASYAKIAAARRLGIPVLLVARPPDPPGPRAESVAETLAWLESRLRGRAKPAQP